MISVKTEAQADIDHRFGYHKLDEARGIAHSQVRSLVWGVASNWTQDLPDGREKSLAITKLEEAMFWANAAIARQK